MTALQDTRVALNPLQFLASPDGWLDPTLAPPLEERLRIIADAGFTAVQTELPADGTDAEYVARLAESGLTPGPGYTRALWSEDAAEQAAGIEASRTAAARFAALGVEVVFFTSGMIDGSERVVRPALGTGFDQGRLERVAGFLSRAAVAMQAEGVAAALHPHVGTWVETEHETRWVLDHSDPALAFGPDIGHLVWAGADHLALLRDYRDRVAGLHIKDYRAETIRSARSDEASYRGTALRGIWAEPGRGDADLDAVADAVRVRPETWTVIEVDRPAASTPHESIALCGEWLRRSRAE